MRLLLVVLLCPAVVWLPNPYKSAALAIQVVLFIEDIARWRREKKYKKANELLQSGAVGPAPHCPNCRGDYSAHTPFLETDYRCAGCGHRWSKK